MTSQIHTENLEEGAVLIIGAGIAGLFTALKLAPLPVTIVTAAPLGRGSSSNWAQGGLAAALGKEDSPRLHLADTIKAGAGLVEDAPARLLTELGPARVEDLIKLGVAFDRDDQGNLSLGKEAAHSRHRIVHFAGDQAGAAIMDALIAAAQAADHITIRERMVAEDILITENGTAAGILAQNIEADQRLLITCPRVILATGGLGGLFAVTTNPVRAQGHGMAMALRAGAEIMDPEFVQFHPTALDIDKDPAPLATEALRGAGAILVNQHNERIMEGKHDALDLAPRDIVARAVAQSLANGKGAFLDATEAIGEQFAPRFPAVYAACQEVGLDPSKDPLPVAPAAHYHMGGIATDLEGATSVPGLYAVGEVAATGIHGANRLASNSLLEALVFGDQIATKLKNSSPISGGGIFLPRDRLALPARPAPDIQMAMLRQTMSHHAGLLRSKSGLTTAMDAISKLEQAEGRTSGLQNALLAATIILVAALDRRESRGSHARLDYSGTATAVHSIVLWDPEKGLIVQNRRVTPSVGMPQ
ncbi:MAG: L-aspartate oxidase [bacterium]